MYRTYTDIMSKAEHHRALGQLEHYLDESADDLPWGQVASAEAGGSYRLDGPADVRLTAWVGEMKFSWSVDFESRDANGTGVSRFDREKMRAVALRLPPAPRRQFTEMLRTECLPGMIKRRDEILSAYNAQADSVSLVRELIDFAGAAK